MTIVLKFGLCVMHYVIIFATILLNNKVMPACDCPAHYIAQEKEQDFYQIPIPTLVLYFVLTVQIYDEAILNNNFKFNWGHSCFS